MLVGWGSKFACQFAQGPYNEALALDDNALIHIVVIEGLGELPDVRLKLDIPGL
jgi:hypothetical protein